MRIACVLINHLAVQVALNEEPALSGKPLVVGGLPFESKPVLDASPEALAYGVRLSMPLREAQAQCPDAAFIIPDHEKYGWAFESVLDVLDNFSPVVDIAKPGCAYIDVTGVECERELASELISSIFTNTGLTASVGIAGGKFFSRVATSVSKWDRVTIVPAGGDEEYIRPFSIDILDCRPEIRERLRFLGIRLVGQLRSFDREALFTQFGDDGLRLFSLSHGIDSSTLVPRKREDIITLSSDLENPASTEVEILQVCQSILEEPLVQIQSRGKVCREVKVRLDCESEHAEIVRLALKEHTSQPKAILQKIRVWLEVINLSSAVQRIGLSLWLVSDNGKRPTFWAEQNEKKRRINHLAKELQKRLGFQPLKKVTEIDPDTIIPEHRFGLTDITSSK